jgi:mono/diheme cytochrome c family protein
MTRGMFRSTGSAALLAATILAGGCSKQSTEGQGNRADAATAGPIERGRYLVTIMDCSGCHNRGAFGPKPEEGHLAGSDVGFELPGLGVFYPPNLTPHPENGIGAWSEADIVKAIRTGARPDGRILAPIMPYNNYGKLTDSDAAAIAAYLKSLPAAPHKSPAPAQPATAKSPYLTVKVPSAP